MTIQNISCWFSFAKIKSGKDTMDSNKPTKPVIGRLNKRRDWLHGLSLERYCSPNFHQSDKQCKVFRKRKFDEEKQSLVQGCKERCLKVHYFWDIFIIAATTSIITFVKVTWFLSLSLRCGFQWCKGESKYYAQSLNVLYFSWVEVTPCFNSLTR